MTETSLHHHLPFIMPGQAQKHVTHNTAIEQIDATMHLVLAGLELNDPPSSPQIGDVYDVGALPTGIFTGHENDIAAYMDSGWQFYPKTQGMQALEAATDQMLVFDGQSWGLISATNGAGETPVLGINTSVDSVNKLAVKSDSVLFSADDQAAAPTGDIRVSVNKTSSADVASTVYQTGFSARAEAGLIGNDSFSLKMSADGSTYKTALEIDSDGKIGVGKTPADAIDVLNTGPGITRISVKNEATTSGAGAALTIGAANGKSLSLLQYNSASAYFLSNSSSLYYQLTGPNPAHRFYLGSTEAMKIEATKVSFYAPPRLPNVTMATLPSAGTSGAGAMIFVSDSAAGAMLAYSDGTDWRQSTDAAILS